jgi:hypothetical protein
MIPPWFQLPDGVINKIGECNDRPVRQFVGNCKVFLVKECRKVSPLPDEMVVGYGEIIVVNKGISQGIQVN